MLKLVQAAGGYEERAVFSNVSFEVEKASVCVLLGRNGCGKTTLLKTMAGLLPLQSGEIQLEGKNVAAFTPKERATQIASLMQRNAGHPITVESLALHGRYPYLPFPRRLAQRDYAMVEKALAQMELTHLKDTLLTNLSGGELQKAYLAMALAQDTPILLLDEPNAYLDIHHQRELLQTLTRLKTEGKTIVTALHELPGALEIADTICVLHEGQQIFFGTPPQLMETDIFSRVFHVDFERLEQGGRVYYSIQ